MLSLRLKFHQQAMQGCVHLLCLQSAKGEVSGCFINYKITIAHRVIERKPQQGDKAQGVHQYVIRAFTSVSVPSQKKVVLCGKRRSTTKESASGHLILQRGKLFKNVTQLVSLSSSVVSVNLDQTAEWL